VTARLELEPIGIIRTPFTNRYDAPRQPGTGASASGVIELLPNRNYEQALEDLDGFDKIWLIYWFDRNPNWKPKVLPPRSEKKRGVFATRSPHRPNPIGLSLVALESIKGLTLKVHDVDLLDQTPILDIKPYLVDVEAVPSASRGWLDELTSPTWVLEWTPDALRDLHLLESFDVNLKDHIERVLAHDPMPHVYRRTSRIDDGYELAVRSWRVRYTIDGSIVHVIRILSGYALVDLQRTDLDDLEAHRAILARN
jgi:tRNA-Thr(GGU) m(6)t(6)A37 methyltransferase TsaA